VSFSDTLSEEDRQNNLILYGLPTDLSLPEELNTVLPAPFEPNSNIAILDNQTVVYRIEPTKSLGFLELLPSPWNANKSILVVSGTNRDGLSFSKQALADSVIRSGLKGNFAVIDGEHFTVVDTRFGLGLGSFPAAVATEVVQKVEPTLAAEIEPANLPTFDITRQIILIVLAVVVGAILLVIILVFVPGKRKISKN
jgi:hypothetical protein